MMSDDIDWLMITGAEEEHQDVLLQIIKIWITIWAISFAKHILETYKQEAKKSTDKVKVLRHNLSLISYNNI